MKELKKGIYYVGMQNPNLRVFDIIMDTEYGTSYNSYLVVGTEKTALIETTHAPFFDDYIESIREIIDPAKIDYLILNHTEPDHTGSLRRLLEINPEITVLASGVGIKFASKIANSTLNARAVRDGESIELGGKTLKFISAPLLHWPDSMFTYCPEDRVVFSCDFLGCHYCEPLVLDSKIIYKERYDAAFDYYFHAIFGPFKDAVLSGLAKLDGLECDMICPSHGPVLTELIPAAKRRYYELCATAQRRNEPKKVLIIYVSAYGCTETLAREMAGRLEGRFEVELVNAIYADSAAIKEKIESCDGLLLGTPTINRDALAPIWNVCASIDAIINKGKPAGVFGSYGWTGEGVGMIIERLKGLKLKVVGEGVKANFVPNEAELEAARRYADEFAEAL